MTDHDFGLVSRGQAFSFTLARLCRDRLPAQAPAGAVFWRTASRNGTGYRADTA